MHARGHMRAHVCRMCTFVICRQVVTSNTEAQLQVWSVNEQSSGKMTSDSDVSVVFIKLFHVMISYSGGRVPVA